MTRRRHRLAALMMAPATVVALGLVGIEAWRTIRPRSFLFTPPFAYSLADAIASGNLPHAYQYIRAGQDPNQRIAVRHPDVTGNRWVFTTPLHWAVATDQIDAVRMLLGFGARVDAAALCLADTLGHDRIAGILRTQRPEDVPAACGPAQRYPLTW